MMSSALRQCPSEGSLCGIVPESISDSNATPSNATPSDSDVISVADSDNTPSNGTPSDDDSPKVRVATSGKKRKTGKATKSETEKAGKAKAGKATESQKKKAGKAKRRRTSRTSQQILADPTTPLFIRNWSDEFQSWSNDRVNQKIWEILQSCRQHKKNHRYSATQSLLGIADMQ